MTRPQILFLIGLMLLAIGILLWILGRILPTPQELYEESSKSQEVRTSRHDPVWQNSKFI